jgi:hypothetical protein
MYVHIYHNLLSKLLKRFLGTATVGNKYTFLLLMFFIKNELEINLILINLVSYWFLKQNKIAFHLFIVELQFLIS